MSGSNSQTEGRSFPARRRFSKEDDAILLEAVEELGTEDFHLIQERLPHWSIRQLKDRYRNYLNPDLNQSEWTPEEDSLLIALYSQIGPKWAQMVPRFQHRSGVNIKNRHAILLARHTRMVQQQAGAALCSRSRVPMPAINIKKASSLHQTGSVPIIPFTNLALQSNETISATETQSPSRSQSPTLKRTQLPSISDLDQLSPSSVFMRFQPFQIK